MAAATNNAVSPIGPETTVLAEDRDRNKALHRKSGFELDELDELDDVAAEIARIRQQGRCGSEELQRWCACQKSHDAAPTSVAYLGFDVLLRANRRSASPASSPAADTPGERRAQWCRGRRRLS